MPKSNATKNHPQHVNHFLTLHALAHHWHAVLAGGEVEECYSVSREQWVMSLKMEGQQKAVVVAVFHPKLSFLYRPDRFVKPNRGWLPQMERLKGAVLQSIWQPDYDRSLVFDFGHDGKLLFKLHGGLGNVIAFSQQGEMTEAFSYRFGKDRTRKLADYALDKEGRKQKIKASLQAGESPQTALSQAIPGAEPALLPARWPGSSTEDVLSCLQTAWEYWQRMAAPPYWLATPGNPGANDPRTFFLLQADLPDEETHTLERHEDLDEALIAFARLFFRRKASGQWYERIHSYIGRRRKYGQKHMKSAERSLEKAEQTRNYRRMGDLLMAYLHEVPVGAQQVVFADFESAAPVSIALKPGLSPQKNAERFYRKAKNQPIEQAQAERKWWEATEILEAVEHEQAQLDAAWQEGLDALRKLARHFGLDKQPDTPQAPPVPYHTFGIDGYTVWVGKNARGNEMLLRQSRKEDIWMHARGFAGSHVIFKQDGHHPAPVGVLEKAASLAAYYSKGKNAGLCPVIYTARKFVRKPKGAAPGVVRVEREEVLIVPPEIPQDLIKN